MTPQEYKEWKEQTANAYGGWTLDEEAFFGEGTLRYLRPTKSSGVVGSYVEAKPDGTATIGSYAGDQRYTELRSPQFTPLYTSKAGDDLATAAAVAFGRLNEWLPEKIPAQLPLLPNTQKPQRGQRSRKNKE